MTGKLYGIGVGPGDPELITVKASRVLKEIRVVCVPKARPNQPSLALAIAKDYLPPEGEVIELVLPMTEVQSELDQAWQKAAETILSRLQQGKDVAFLTLGDPSLYSTFSYISKVLKGMVPEIKTEIIPGITSFSAVAAAAEEPLAEKDEPLLILPLVNDLILDEGLVSQANLVMMKISRNFDSVLEQLEKSGRLGGSLLASRCGQPEEFLTRNLKSLAGKKVDYLSLIFSKKPGGEG